MPTTISLQPESDPCVGPQATWRTHLRWLTVLLTAALIARVIAVST